jgi:hypothetical protein
MMRPATVKKTLAGSPDDLNAHLKLIGHYSDNAEKRNDWLKHILWLVDHHPESAALGILPLPPVQMVFDNRQWFPPLEVINEYRKHWAQAVAAHPRDVTIVFHAALALGNIDPNLGLPLARKAVELDPACGEPNNEFCRGLLGGMYGLAILRRGSSYVPCLPKTPDAEHTVAALRKEIESLTDPEILVSAGLTIRGGERCGGNADDAVQFGMKLIRKAVTLDPSLIDRDNLQDMLNPKRN